jgi:hypothetical protein
MMASNAPTATENRQERELPPPTSHIQIKLPENLIQRKVDTKNVDGVSEANGVEIGDPPILAKPPQSDIDSFQDFTNKEIVATAAGNSATKVIDGQIPTNGHANLGPMSMKLPSASDMGFPDLQYLPEYRNPCWHMKASEYQLQLNNAMCFLPKCQVV